MNGLLKKSFCVLSALTLAACFAACDGDDGASAKAEKFGSSVDELSSSSDEVKFSSSNADVVSSSADEVKSSSSQMEKSSSSVKISSSSSNKKDDVSSSSDKVELSSSVVIGSSSSSVVESSSSIEIPEGWSWDVPKEARLNPNVEYGTMTDSRDGQQYKTVTIGSQTWMAENLNYADSVNTPSLKGNSWCYDNDPDKCAVTGRLYTWAASMDFAFGRCAWLTADDLAANPIQGICPSGWHLPSHAEWDALRTAAGGIGIAGNALRSASGWYSNGNGTDAYGFSALPAGGRDYGGNFYDAGYSAGFWSASQVDSDEAYYMYGEFVFPYYVTKDYGFSVRCLKNSN